MVKIVKKTKPVTATVSSQMKDHGDIVAESTTAEKVNVPAEITKALDPVAASGVAYCEVEVDASYTHNLGNFKSAKMGVAIRVPCLHAEVDKVYDWASGWLEKRMEPIVAGLIAQNPDA